MPQLVVPRLAFRRSRLRTARPHIDIIHWALGSNPVMVMGCGGRQERVQPQYGNGYDHFATEFEFENEVRVSSMCRQQTGASHNVSERLVGTKGQVYLDGSSGRIIGENPYEYDGPNVDPYVAGARGPHR